MSYQPIQGVIHNYDGTTTVVPAGTQGTVFHTDNVAIHGVLVDQTSTFSGRAQFHAGRVTGRNVAIFDNVSTVTRVPAKDAGADFFVNGKPVEFVNSYHGPLTVIMGEGAPQIVEGPGAKQ